MADLVIRNARIVDGTGAPAFDGHVAVEGDRIVAVTTDAAELPSATRTVDADGLTLTPGFVDIHTHFDGQATWDPILAPSSIHGVTSLVMGNCGVGFAPARPTEEDHAFLISMLEGGGHPGTALAEGLTWDWESFTDYLDALGRRSYALDVATHITHAPLRAFVMGVRGADPEEAPTPTSSPRWLASCVRAWRLAPSASRPAAPTCTAPRTGPRSAPGSPAPTNCWRSWARWPRPAAASSR